MKHIKYLWIAAVITIVAAGAAYAGISVTPDRYVVSLLPGEEETVMYHIYNSGDEDIDIVIEAKAWSGIKDPYQWLSLESDTVYVKAGESTPFTVKLNAPEEVTGEMVAMLFLCYKDSMESQLNVRNGVPVYMIIKGTENYDINIEDVEVSYGRKGDFYDLNFMVSIKNTGNAHIAPDVSVIIKNDKGRVLNTLFLERPNIVLREKDQTYRLGWREPGLRDGLYTATAILDYEDKIEKVSKEIEFHVSGDYIGKTEPVKAGD